MERKKCESSTIDSMRTRKCVYMEDGSSETKQAQRQHSNWRQQSNQESELL